MSTNLVMMITLTTSTTLCFFANSWATIWILLEMNTLAFCSLMFIKFSNEMKKNKELTMKYLIIQSVASAMLVTMSLLLKTNAKMTVLTAILVMLSLMVKTASAPTHQWFINMSKKTTWKVNTILFTWQKFAPTFLIVYQTKLLLLPFLILSGMLGATSMMNKSMVKEILAFSSLFNLSWMFLAITISTKVFVLFSITYWVSLLFILFFFDKNNTLSTQEMAETKKNKVPMVFMLMSLAGLPPLMGFVAKWITLYSSLNLNLKPLTTTLLILSAINLFVYLRLVNPTLMKNSSCSQSFLMSSQILMATSFFYLNTILMMMLLV